MTNKILILGSGTSTGIPIPGCLCEVCQSTNPKNKRLRTSIILKFKNDDKKGHPEKTLLVDTTPDLRQGLLNHKINRVDATIITHTHADHLHGIDDLRPLCFGPPARTIPVYVHSKDKKDLIQRFPYIFDNSQQKPQIGGGIPLLDLKTLDTSGPISLLGKSFEFFLLPHGYGQTLGFSQGKFAYLIDCHDIPQQVLEFLKKRELDFLIMDCVCIKPHKTHLNVEKAFSFIKEISPKKAGLIHMGHEIDHDVLQKMAEESFDFPVFPLSDGMVLDYCSE
tara:strand:- start:254 stop:1090 length:837 start_codon:yes stop_codon:yes gene_type:complete